MTDLGLHKGIECFAEMSRHVPEGQQQQGHGDWEVREYATVSLLPHDAVLERVVLHCFPTASALSTAYTAALGEPHQSIKWIADAKGCLPCQKHIS